MSNSTFKPAVWAAVGAVIGAGVFSGFAKKSGTIETRAPLFSSSDSVPSVQVDSKTSADLSALRNLDSAFVALVSYVEPAVVHIRVGADGNSRNSFGRGGAEGSGVIYRDNGWIITNDHVVAGSDTCTVVLNDGREFKGKVTHSNDMQNDIAVVKIDASDLPTVKFADSSLVRPGEFAIAVGSPFGLQNTVTIGHVSALGRSSKVQDPQVGMRGYTNLLQTDASINPGNSGGPLLNVNGEVIGINTSILGNPSAFGGEPGSVGIGFAIPSSQVHFLADTLISKGKLQRGYLGIGLDDLKPYELKDRKLDGGALVTDVPADGPASKSGIQKGDVIEKIGDLTVKDQQDVRTAMVGYAQGATVKLVVLRGNKTINESVKAGAVPKEMTANKLQDGQNDGMPKGFGDIPPQYKPFFRGFGDDNGNSDDQAPKAQHSTDGKPHLGIRVMAITPDVRSQYHIPANAKGAVIESVEDDSLASSLGLQAGDVITQLGDAAISGPTDLTNAMSKVRSGDTKRLSFERYGDNSRMSQTTSVTFN